jgi:hypothetical protein
MQRKDKKFLIDGYIKADKELSVYEGDIRR